MELRRGLKLQAQSLSKVFGTFVANEKIDLNISAGTIHGLVGENGAGKSTLLKSLSGLHRPTSGSIFIDDRPLIWSSAKDAQRAGIGMVHQHFALVDNRTVLENIILGSEPRTVFGKIKFSEARLKVESLMSQLDLKLPLESEIQNLTVSQKQNVEFLKLLYEDSRLLILDEPTAVLTPQEITNFLAVLVRLRSMGKTIILVTHKLREIFEVCDTISVLRQGKCVWSGNKDQISEKELIQKMMGQSLSTASPVQARPKEFFSEDSVLSVRNLKDLNAFRGALKLCSFDVQKGEVLGIAGVEGSGQLSLFEMILGLRPFDGQMKLMGSSAQGITTAERRAKGLSVIPEDRHKEGLWLGETVSMNLIAGIEDQFSSCGFLNPSKTKSTTDQLIKKFDIRTESCEKKVQSLSGGNQQKVIFARELGLRSPRLLICYHPTRGVDLGAIHLIHTELRKLAKEGLSVLYISPDIDELFQISDRILVLFDGQITGEFHSNEYDRNKVGKAMTCAEAVNNV